MNLRNRDTYLDNLLRQAMQPYVYVQPSETVWRRIRRRIQGDGPVRWHRLFSWVWSPFTTQERLAPQFRYFEPGGRSTLSPFPGVMVKQMLDMRLAL